jgi:acyl carrier protein
MERVGELYEYAFVSFAAKLLGVSPETLKGAAYGQIPEWDSVNHIRLAMEAEKRFDVSYPIERIPEMRTVRDFLSQG